jgi:hypothetical protein
MIRAHIDRSAVPWWAAFGAPLVGVPLLVGLLALGSAGHHATQSEPDPGFTVEQSEALQAGIELPPVAKCVATEARG